jgi:3-isopropylmalate dehydratase small subunit
MFGIGSGGEWAPFATQQAWEPYINGARATSIYNQNRRELENIMLSEQLAEKKHQQEMMKMVLDTNRAIRKMHEETRMEAYKTQSQIANQWTRALGGGGGG